MILKRFGTGDILHRYLKSLVLEFAGPRDVASTAQLGGGLRHDLTSVFNHDGTLGAGMEMRLEAPTYLEHMAIVASRLGLDPERTSGMLTAAQMENVSMHSMSHGSVTVTAIVTGGVETNGGRAGDEGSWDEETGQEAPERGTINSIVFIDAALNEGALERCIVTATEAKTAALQELQAPSRFSCGLATGSGTDSTIIVSNPAAPVSLTNPGKHTKLGELIGKTEKEAVKQALLLQTGLGPYRMHNALRRVDRFGITETSLWEAYGKGGPLSRAMFSEASDHAMQAESAALVCGMFAHLLDELEWGMAEPQDVCRPADAMLSLIGLQGEALAPHQCTADYLTTLLSKALAGLILSEGQGQ
jgi:adenosylcobinamide amidohydrolase